MFDQFETVMNKNGELFIWSLLEDWEHHMGIKQTQPITLEERWMRFLAATEADAAPMAA